MIQTTQPSKALTAAVVALALIAAGFILRNTQAQSAPEKRSANEQTHDTELFIYTHRDPMLGLRRGNQTGNQAARDSMVVLHLRPADPG